MLALRKAGPHFANPIHELNGMPHLNYMMPAPKSSHISILDPLRGAAALAVVLFHYSGSILPSITPNLLTPFFAEGKLGVQVFFVISGFVIPYSMFKGGYALKQFPAFMWRRWKRIAPPAYLAALMMIAYHFASVLITGHPVAGSDFPGLGWRPLIANLTFTPDYLGTTWYNFVYWTLTMEFEFYALIGICLPLLLNNRPAWSRPGMLLLLLALSFVGGPSLFPYLHYFILGLVVFLYKEVRLTLGGFISMMLLCIIVGLLHHQYLGTIVAAAAALLIVSGLKCNWKIAAWGGTISYSLYITHAPVGYFAESMMKRVTDIHANPMGKVALLLFYTMLALVFAHLFHHSIEKPFLRWSQKKTQ